MLLWSMRSPSRGRSRRTAGRTRQNPNFPFGFFHCSFGAPSAPRLSVLHSEEIVEGRVAPSERAVTDGEEEVALREDLVDAVVLQRHRLLGHRLQRGTQSKRHKHPPALARRFEGLVSRRDLLE